MKHNREEWRKAQKEVKQLFRSRLYQSPERAEVQRKSVEISEKRRAQRAKTLENR